MSEKLKLHELSEDKVKEKDLFWLVAVRDTVDWKGTIFPDQKDHIKNIYPKAVIKKGDIVWYCKDDLRVRGNEVQLIFNNVFEVNYFKKDFRELTQEEKEEYLK